MTLRIDVESSNAFEESALAAAKAFDYLAGKETTVNAMAEKIGDSYRAAKKEAVDFSHYASKEITPPSAGGGGGGSPTGPKPKEPDKDKANKKDIDAQKKKKEEQKKQLELAKSFVKTVIAGASAVAGIGVALAFVAKGASDTKREAAALIDAFTARRGPATIAVLDTLTKNLGGSIDETRAKFVEFRQAGIDNKMSVKLIKMRADLMAVGLSAEGADKEISYAVSAADGMGNLQVIRRMAELSKAYGGIGSGAKAAAFQATSLSGAQNKISNVVGEKLNEVWQKIGPGIGTAANRLADFTVKMMNSEDGKKVIQGVADAFKAVTDAVNDENLTTGLNAIKALGGAVVTVFEAAGQAIGFVAFKIAEVFQDNGSTIATASNSASYQAVGYGRGVVDGMTSGMKAGAPELKKASVAMAKDVATPFAAELGIHSPSKVFADYGKSTVAGFQQGEENAMGGRAMPLQDAAAEAVEMPQRGGKSNSSSTQVTGGGITIENITIQGGNSDEMMRNLRRELQLLLQAGSISRGVA